MLRTLTALAIVALFLSACIELPDFDSCVYEEPQTIIHDESAAWATAVSLVATVANTSEAAGPIPGLDVPQEVIDSVRNGTRTALMSTCLAVLARDPSTVSPTLDAACQRQVDQTSADRSGLFLSPEWSAELSAAGAIDRLDAFEPSVQEQIHVASLTEIVKSEFAHDGIKAYCFLVLSSNDCDAMQANMDAGIEPTGAVIQSVAADLAIPECEEDPAK